MILRTWLISLFILAGHSGQTAMAGSLEEEKNSFAQADKKLNAAYLNLKKSLPKWSFEELQKDQRDWIGYRDALADRTGFDDGQRENPKTSSEYWKMATELTKTRVEVLNGWAAINRDPSWPGVYRDSYGGLLTVTLKDGKLHFKLSVVRGPTHHVGDISGVAKINRHAARFSDNGKADGEDKAGSGETWLDFRLIDGARIKLSGINTGYYHGARASFDGTYVKIK